MARGLWQTDGIQIREGETKSHYAWSNLFGIYALFAHDLPVRHPDKPPILAPTAGRRLLNRK